MATALDLIEAAQKKGITPEKIMSSLPENARPMYKAYLDKGQPQQMTPREIKTTPNYDIPGLPNVEAVPMSLNTKRAISEFYTPALEMGGMGVGSTVGMAGGVFTPVPGGAAIGMGVGGTLGYGIGKSTARALDEWLGLIEPPTPTNRSITAAKDLKTGAMYEMGGQSAIAGVVGTVKGSWNLAMRIPGAENFINRIKKFSPSLNMGEVVKKAKVALQEYKDSLALSQTQKSTVNDAVSAVRKYEQQLVQKSESAVKNAIVKATELKGRNPQQVGELLYTELKGAMAESKAHVDALYNMIPDGVTVPPNRIIDTIKTVIKDYKTKGGRRDSFPKAIVDQMVKGVKEAKKSGDGIPFRRLWEDWRSQIGEEIRDASKGISPNYKRVRRLKMLESGVDDAMEEIRRSGNDAVVDLYEKATAAFSKHHDIFRKGAVNEVLRPGNLITGNKVPFSDIPSRFFKQGGMDKADDLIRAVGNVDSKRLIRDYAAQDLYSTAKQVDGSLSVNSGTRWMTKNASVLKKYGLYDEFSNIVNSQYIADGAVKNLNAFHKTIASKILNTDVNKVVSNVYSGVGMKGSAKVTQDLLNVPGIKGNKKAIEGIRESFKDFLFKSMDSKYTDSMGVPIKDIAKAKSVVNDYMPALEILYKDSPKQIVALKKYHELLSSVENIIADSAQGPVKRIVESIAQLGFIQAGAGWKYSASRNIARQLYEMSGSGPKNQVETLLRRAIYDPEVAQTIMTLGEKGPSPTIKKTINHYFLKYGIYASDKAYDYMNENF